MAESQAEPIDPRSQSPFGMLMILPGIALLLAGIGMLLLARRRSSCAGAPPQLLSCPARASDADRIEDMRSLDQIAAWPVDHASALVVDAHGTVRGVHGEQTRIYPLASVTKILASYAVLIAVEEGAVELSQPAGPDGSTLRHLLAHASGLDFDSERVRAEPGTRRIYSNTGFEVIGSTLEAACEMSFAAYLHEAVLEPLGMVHTELNGSPAHAASSTTADLARFAAELMAPTLLHPSTLHDARTVQFTGLDGVLPGFGRQRPCDWGLGFSIKDAKSPHWTAPSGSPETFGHFGQSGTFLWVDPRAGIATIALTDRAFGPWAAEAWPVLGQAVLDELG